jgi:hypothetical protein
MASLYRTKRARAGISVLYGRLCSRTYWLAWSRDSVTPSVLRLALLDWRAGTVKPYVQVTDCPNAMIAADGLIVAVNGTKSGSPNQAADNRPPEPPRRRSNHGHWRSRHASRAASNTPGRRHQDRPDPPQLARLHWHLQAFGCAADGG